MQYIFVRKPPRSKWTKIKCIRNILDLQYLREHLSGAAQKTIAGLYLLSSNYQVAQELLRERFGDQQIRINAHHAALMNLP